MRPDAVDLRSSGALRHKIWVIRESGLVAGALDHSADGVVRLANEAAPFDDQLNAGDVVLAGSFRRPTAAVAGDNFQGDSNPLGSIAFHSV